MLHSLNVRLADPRNPGEMRGDRLIASLPVRLMGKWLAIPFAIALALIASPGALADELQDYADQCNAAIGAAVTEFDCDSGTEVEGQGEVYGPDAICDQPNRLNKECDPGSHFQVLT